MNYYEELKLKTGPACEKTAARLKEFDRQIEKSELQLQNEIDNEKNYRERISKLKLTAGERISESQSSYEKFKVSMRKLKYDAEVANEIIESLQNDYLPRLKDKRAETVVELELSLQEIGLANPIADVPRDTCLDTVVKALAAFQSERVQMVGAWQKLYAEYGLTFSDSAMTVDMLPAILEGVDNNEQIKRSLTNG